MGITQIAFIAVFGGYFVGHFVLVTHTSHNRGKNNYSYPCLTIAFILSGQISSSKKISIFLNFYDLAAILDTILDSDLDNIYHYASHDSIIFTYVQICWYIESFVYRGRPVGHRNKLDIGVHLSTKSLRCHETITVVHTERNTLSCILLLKYV